MSFGQIGRAVLFVLPFMCFTASGIGCTDPISPEKYLALSLKTRVQYELITSGPDAGKYKPRFTEKVTAPGTCTGKYEPPCNHLGGQTVIANSLACDAIRALTRSKDPAPKPALTADERNRLPDSARAQYESITEGPDVCKFKIKYYSRVNSPIAGTPPPAPGTVLYANPCGHLGGQTVTVDKSSCALLTKLAGKSDKKK